MAVGACRSGGRPCAATSVLGRDVDVERPVDPPARARRGPSSSASAWTAVRGKPSRIAPSRGVGLGEPVEEHADDRRVGHELAAAHVPLGLAAERPSRRPTAARSRSPDARMREPRCSARTGAWVPFPAPGAPEERRSRSIGIATSSPDEPFVVAHHELRFDLLHRLDDDADHDQQARAAEGDAGRATGRAGRRLTARTATMPRKRAPATVIRVDDPGQVVRRRPARPDARDEAAVLAELLGGLVGLERERRVEVRESEGQQEVQGRRRPATAG